MSLDAMMAELQKEYIAGLSEKVIEVQSYLEKLDLKAAQNLFHKLKGSGATYGIPEASQLGDLMENYFKKVNAQKTPTNSLDPKILSNMAAGVEMLRKISAARKSETPYSLENDPQYLLLLPQVKPAARVTSHGSD
jgi:chemotaxis protein histidine kinase CheA